MRRIKKSTIVDCFHDIVDGMVKTEGAMVGKINKKNDAAKWLDLYGDALYGFAMIRVHNSFVAEDLVQETLLAAYASYDKFSGRSTLKTWLTGIMRHKVQDYFRKLKPEQGDQSLNDFAAGLDSMFDKRDKWKIKPGDWGYDPQKLFEQKELMTIIFSCFSDMPSRISLAYRMHA